MCRCRKSLTLARALLCAGIVLGLGGKPAHADFFLRDFGIPYLYDFDGTLIRSYGQGMFEFGEPWFTEAIEAFTLSADREQVYVFGNDLGDITNFVFDLDSGNFLGPRGVNGTSRGDWPAGFQDNFGITRPLTRNNDLHGNGDLFFIGLGQGQSAHIVNLIDTSTGDPVGQIELPFAAYDMAFATGPQGPETRLYLARNSGIHVYDEKPMHDIRPFELAFSFALPTTIKDADIEIGPDGYLYVLSNPTNSTSPYRDIRRYDRLTGQFIDIVVPSDAFVAASEYMDGIQFSPGGDLYVTVLDWDVGEIAGVHRYDTVTKQLVADYDGVAYTVYGGYAEEFFVLSDPVPEPGAGILVAIAGAYLCGRLPRRS